MGTSETSTHTTLSSSSQVQLLILVSLPCFLGAFNMFAQVFMVLDEPHHCSVAWVKNQTLNLSAAQQLALSVPLDATGSPQRCLMFRPPPDGASLEDILSHSFNETQSCETGWDYPEGRPPSLENEVRLPCGLSVHLFWVRQQLCLSLCPQSLVWLPLPLSLRSMPEWPLSSSSSAYWALYLSIRFLYLGGLPICHSSLPILLSVLLSAR